MPAEADTALRRFRGRCRAAGVRAGAVGGGGGVGGGAAPRRGRDRRRAAHRCRHRQRRAAADPDGRRRLPAGLTQVIKEPGSVWLAGPGPDSGGRPR